MLPIVPRKYRAKGDDSAPQDYRFVASVAEGARHRQGLPIHPPQPGQQPDALETTETRKPTAYRIPRASDGPAPAASVAYPRQRSNAFAQTPGYAPRSPAPLAAAEVDRAYASAAAASVPDTAGEIPAAAPASETPFSGDAASASYRRTRRAAALPGTARDGQPPQPSEKPVPPGVTETPVVPAQSAPQPDRVLTLEGGQYAVPPTQEVPDWLQAARQNRTVPQHPRPPQVQAAPPQEPQPALDPLGRPILRGTQPQSRAATYADAGYPPELIARQRSEEAQAAILSGYGHIRHGAQYAVPPRQRPPAAAASAAPSSPPAYYPPPRETYTPGQPTMRNPPPPAAGTLQSEPPRANPYYALQPEESSPYQVIREEGPGRRRAPQEEDETAEEPPRKRNIPYLGIAAFLLAMLAITLFILQTSFTRQREAVLTARTEAQVKLLDSHQFLYRELIEREANANNLHPAFVAAIIFNESSFNPNAESVVGARGLMQMMPDTAEWVHGKIDAVTTYTFDLMYDPDKNVTYACWYLAYLSNRFHGDPVLVSAAFHAGQTTVENWLNDSRYSADSQTIELKNMTEGPTKNYATRIMNSYAIYRRLYYEGGAQALEAAGANAAS
ncbi:MAG: transglycosylase SLT domain-containing protein [Eubacteriales bacterium]|nr:transglycosylase SLT domain-containing protein [Eubacteriales bacterium]